YSYWIVFFQMFLVFFFGFSMIINLAKKRFTIEKKIVELAPGMLPVETFIRREKIVDVCGNDVIREYLSKEGHHYYKKIEFKDNVASKNDEILFDKSPNDFRRYHKILFLRRTSGLTEWDIREMLYRLENGLLDSDTIKIQEKIPFAPSLFLGVILAYIFKGNFISYLLLFISG
ncbi:MAG: hypothetical protein KAS30_04715, partial [Candidatus Diapherotrites archaeon]|nr:hypothetical protein [Candidatus Diapherotrites archaeon]